MQTEANTAPRPTGWTRARADLREALITSRPGLVHRHVAPVDVDDEPTDDCISGSCQMARPGGAYNCACGGAEHGAKSLLAPAVCGGTRVLRDIVAPGDIRFAACPGAKAGCPDCAQAEKDQAARYAEPISAVAGARAFARLAVAGGLAPEDPDWF